MKGVGFKRFIAIFIAVAVVCSLAVGLTGCGGKGKTKIGVLVADINGDEALSFKAYYEEYLEKQYDVDFVYSGAMEDAAGEKAQIESWAAQGVKAVISFSDNDRAQQIETCADKKMYYAVATGMLSDEDYATYKSNEYFVGQIGPSMETEYNTGLAMGEYYADKEVTKIGLYGAFIPNPMHVYRFAGIITGLGLTYDGASGMGVVGKIYSTASAEVDASKIAGDINVSYLAGYNPETIYAQLGGILATNPDAFLSVGMTTVFFAANLNEANVPYADIDSFSAANGTNMKTGKLEYLAGKYASSIGPIFAATMSAINGAPIRDNGNAISIGQDFWVATSSSQFELFQSADSKTNPIYNKELLDTVIATSDKAVTFSAFKTFVETDRTPVAA